MAQGQRRSKGAFHRIVHAFAGIDRDRTLAKVVQWKYMHLQTGSEHPPRPLSSDYQDQRPEHRAHAVRGHRGRRPPSLKKGGRTETRREPPRRFWHLARQRLGPDTSRGRPGARHPPLRRDSATLGRLPGDLRRRLDQDGQARSTRPARALPPGFFALAQPASPAAAPGTGSSPEEEVRLDSLGGWCLRYTRRPPDE